MLKATPDQLLGMTARWTAAVRARESERQDSLFNDPWAAALAGKEGQEWIESRSADSVSPIVLRTRFFDDFMQRITFQHRILQVVLVATGLDTRAFRLKWPEQTRLFELDQSLVLQHKDQVLGLAGAQLSCVRQTVPVNLTTPWEEPLIKVGFNPRQPSAWLLEGFLFYIPNESILRLLDQVTSLAAPASWMGFDIVNSITLSSPLTKQWVEMQAQLGAPWIGTLDDPEEFLGVRGWQVTLSQAGQPDANHGRWPYPVISTKMPGIPHNWFVTAQKEGTSRGE